MCVCVCVCVCVCIYILYLFYDSDSVWCLQCEICLRSNNTISNFFFMREPVRGGSEILTKTKRKGNSKRKMKLKEVDINLT